ncbi:hypothetical protein Bhyg_08312 [Pseudolycoriella hygida]|uniref:Uncharacterized protein n=1 Tax=Pseudolycoriella hygida TaxID=35572 RepID=A0A9Q0N582_9DIPT|nr:hypothetical protein Bhyg_08312 [Pseudolycoriella hygida]
MKVLFVVFITVLILLLSTVDTVLSQGCNPPCPFPPFACVAGRCMNIYGRPTVSSFGK